MIEQEIIDIENDPLDDGSRLNDLADEFRFGRDVNELLTLLDSPNPDLICAGGWILGELPVQLYGSREIIAKLLGLTDHEHALVRFYAFGAVFPFLSRDQASTRELIAKMRADPNEGVRASGEAGAKNLGIDSED